MIARTVAFLACMAFGMALFVGCTDPDVIECPDGREYTEWCGCEPPVYGDDC